MLQKDYSNFIKKGLEKEFAELSNSYRFENDIYITEFASPNKELVIWISTQDCELTIGLDKSDDCVWHTHMSQLEAYDSETELLEGIKFLERVFNGTEKIVQNLKNEFYITDAITESTNEILIETWQKKKLQECLLVHRLLTTWLLKKLNYSDQCQIW